MQKSGKFRPLVALTDAIHSSALNSFSEADEVVPASFAAWLSRPSPTITTEPKPEPGTFAGLADRRRVQTFAGKSGKFSRR